MRILVVIKEGDDCVLRITVIIKGGDDCVWEFPWSSRKVMTAFESGRYVMWPFRWLIRSPFLQESEAQKDAILARRGSLPQNLPLMSCFPKTAQFAYLTLTFDITCFGWSDWLTPREESRILVQCLPQENARHTCPYWKYHPCGESSRYATRASAAWLISLIRWPVQMMPVDWLLTVWYIWYLLLATRVIMLLLSYGPKGPLFTKRASLGQIHINPTFLIFLISPTPKRPNSLRARA